MGYNKILARKESLILRELTLILTRELQNPTLNAISINEVRLSRDNSSAKIFYSFLSFNEEINKETVAAALTENYKKIRMMLAHKIELRTVPELVFAYDVSLQNANHIEDILKEVNK
jgi:ribosome-binding factor A